jgi:predicted amidohydrolase YtcJ
VLIRGGKVAAAGDQRSPGGRQLDASGRYVLPGGVDPHCHLMPGVQAATAAAAPVGAVLHQRLVVSDGVIVDQRRRGHYLPAARASSLDVLANAR